MNIQLDSIFVWAFLAFVVISIFVGTLWIVSTEKRLKKFFLGKKAKDLEDTILLMQNQIEKLLKSTEKIEKDIDDINSKLRKSVRGVHTLRFNPFPDQGSNQSFAVGLLDGEGDGVVLSSLYSRERMSVFAKPVKNHKSEYELTEEEKNAIEKARV